MKNRKAIFDRVLAFCGRENLFSHKDRVLVSLSGGKDSVTLLHILIKMREIYDLSLSAFHLHHGIRDKDADRDEEFCRNLCNAYNIPLHVMHADVPALAKKWECGLEEAGRKERYRLLFAIADQNDCTKIATAHTASDQSETLLMHLIRGAGIRGLAGIRPQNDRLIRPLLCLTSEEILCYTRENNLLFCEDQTNQDTAYFRNYVRHRLLPAIKEKNPAADLSFSHFAEIAAENDAYFSALAVRTLNEWGDTKKGLPLIRLRNLLKESGALLPLEAVMTHWLGRSLAFEQVKAIARLISEGQEGAAFSIGGQDVLVLQEDRLVLNPPVRNDFVPQVIALHEGYNPLPGYSFALDVSACRMGENCENISEKGYTFFLSSATIESLTVRTKADGDKYRAHGQTKCVKKLFSDQKIKLCARASWPLVCDEQGIVCAPLFPQADRTIGKNIKITFLREDQTK